MTLDEAIQHCKEQVQEQAKRGCYSCAEEHQQLAEWLTELKAYREQRGERMNVEEKERLIKKDIESIENRVRHAFNQGYEIGLKESRSENPNTCGDAISRQAVLDEIDRRFDLAKPFKQLIESMPSVTPQQRTGRWIDDDHAMAIKALEQENILDKIRAEIAEFEEEVFHRTEDYSDYAAVRYCLEIIDKYKAESEDKE